MSRFKLKKNHLSQNQKEIKLNEKIQTLILELSGKDFKAAITKKSQQRNSMHQQKIFRRYREEPSGNFRTNNLITEMKNSMSRLGSSVEETEERNGELEDKIIEPIRSEQ